MGKGGVTQSLDQKVYDLILQLLEDQTEEMKQNSGHDESQWFLDVALARDLRAGQILEYIQMKDMSLRRMKRAVLESSISSVLKVVIRDEEAELGEAIRLRQEHEEAEALERDEEGFAGEGSGALMEVKDTNAFNRSLVAQWKLDDNKETKDTKEAKETNEEEEETKGKKRGTGSGRGTSKKKTKIDHTPPTATLSQLGGLETVTAQLMELVGLPMLHGEIFQATGVEPPRGVLLYGPPGCGKTTIANALAGELQVPFISFLAPSIVAGMSGESEKKLREIFDEARLVAPSIVFIDEIDAITPKRDGGAQREMERRIVAQLLTLMDELTLDKLDGKPVVVMGATNRPDSLDLALRRAGRFDREICLSVPTEEQRGAMLRAMTAPLKLAAGQFDFRSLAKMTPGFVGADLKSLVTAAGVVAIKRIFEGLVGDEMDVESNCPSPAEVEATPAEGQVSLIEMAGQSISTPSVSGPAIQRFLARHPLPLTPAQLEPLAITYDDFLQALPTVQPTAKREGFATVPDVTWRSVGALEKIRMELHMCIVQPIKKPELYKKVGISAPAGVLMWGPPGCGKTLLAKAVANESRANFISVKGPELLNKYVGESERAVRQVFQRAAASVPCVIFFDELDALVPRRSAGLSESSSRVVNTLLTELDGLSARAGIFVIAATNRPDMIDPAMLRPGRLDKSLYIELPSTEERAQILSTLVKANATPLAPSVDLAAVAADPRCRNFSGADLSLLVREAGVFALKGKFFAAHNVSDLDKLGFYDPQAKDDDFVVVTADHFAAALATIKPSVTDKDRLRYDRLNSRMGWGVDEANPN